MQLNKYLNSSIYFFCLAVGSFGLPQACRTTKTAYLSTLHGRQNLHFSNRNFNLYGPLCATVCENIREQMLSETRAFKPKQLVVLRNGIEIQPGRGAA